jgi:hypothetical protein
MGDKREFENLKTALGPAADCPPLEQLARALEAGEGEAWRKSAEEHVAACAHCRDELAMMREFLDAGPRPEEAGNIAWITRRLEKQRVVKPVRGRMSGWFGMRAWAAAACLLLVAGSLYYMQRGGGAPALTGPGAGVMRSQVLELVEPVGDVSRMPQQFRWQSVPSAAHYQVRLMEVDRREIWEADTATESVGIPSTVLAFIAPGRSLLWEVKAFDQAGKPLSTSGTSFRVSPESR